MQNILAFSAFKRPNSIPYWNQVEKVLEWADSTFPDLLVEYHVDDDGDVPLRVVVCSKRGGVFDLLCFSDQVSVHS